MIGMAYLTLASIERDAQAYDRTIEHANKALEILRSTLSESHHALRTCDSTAVRYMPLRSEFRGILRARDRIQDRLLRQSRWLTAEARPAQQIKLIGADRTV